MENKIRVPDDEQVELSHEKQPYEAPRLKKLGTVQDLTLGGFFTNYDDGAAYMS